MDTIHPDTPANRSLHQALSKNDPEAVQKALSSGALPNAVIVKPYSRRLMGVVALEKNNPLIVKLLADHGARFICADHRLPPDAQHTPSANATRVGPFSFHNLYPDRMANDVVALAIEAQIREEIEEGKWTVKASRDFLKQASLSPIENPIHRRLSQICLIFLEHHGPQGADLDAVLLTRNFGLMDQFMQHHGPVYRSEVEESLLREKDPGHSLSEAGLPLARLVEAWSPDEQWRFLMGQAPDWNGVLLKYLDNNLPIGEGIWKLAQGCPGFEERLARPEAQPGLTKLLFAAMHGDPKTATDLLKIAKASKLDVGRLRYEEGMKPEPHDDMPSQRIAPGQTLLDIHLQRPDHKVSVALSRALVRRKCPLSSFTAGMVCQNMTYSTTERKYMPLLTLMLDAGVDPEPSGEPPCWTYARRDKFEAVEHRIKAYCRERRFQASFEANEVPERTRKPRF